MLLNTVNGFINGDCFIQNIVVMKAVPNPDRYINTKGEKLYDRLFYISKGTFYIREKGKNQIIAKEGSLVYLPKGVEYVSYWDKSIKGEYITFNYIAFNLNKVPMCLDNKISLIAVDKSGALYNLLNEAYKLYINQEKFAPLLLKSYFFEIMYNIFKINERAALKKDNKIREIYKAVIYLEDNYMTDITSEDLAKMCNISVATFRRLFKNIKGVSPYKYKNSLRMKHAKSMLESGVYTVSEVCEIMGCTDLSHFNRLYKAEFGQNPSAAKLIF